MPFASARVTVLSTIVGAPSGVLASWVPWAIGALGVVLALLAAALTELLVRRRDAAESEVTATDPRLRPAARHRLDPPARDAALGAPRVPRG